MNNHNQIQSAFEYRNILKQALIDPEKIFKINGDLECYRAMKDTFQRNLIKTQDIIILNLDKEVSQTSL